MPVTIVVGAQWGDEGKGRIVDFLATASDAVARFGGGANAGHTVRVGANTYRLSIVPSGVIAGKDCIIGPGTVVSPQQFVAEVETLQAAGIDTARVWLSDVAHLILPYHVALDRAAEEDRGPRALGTTGKGIGPAYVDRAARTGLRAGDLRDLEKCRSIIRARRSELLQRGLELDPSAEVAALEALAPKVLPHVRDTVTMLWELLKGGKRVLAEGAQGTLLDVNFGSYPYVTSSVTIAGGACAGLGIGPKEIDYVVGAVKAYQTRVGAGPFPTELSGLAGDRLRELGREFGVVTGRPRRCGWLDLPALRYAVGLNGLTHIALTKLDVFDSFDELHVCTEYRDHAGESLPFMLCQGAHPTYAQLPGWRQPIGAARAWEDLPNNARAYIEFVESRIGVPVSYVSVGPERSQIVVRSGAPIGPVPTAA